MTGADTGGADLRLKRLRLRSWRRGTREADLLLGPFADSRLAAMDEPALAGYEALLSQDDHDIYAWISGSALAPAAFAETLGRICSFHAIR
ncbi:succinate dehydrogenase assembly factor 2 [soil metagenome]